MATFETTYEPGIHLIARRLEGRPLQPLPRAVVLVPSERHAHATRRHVIVERQRPQDLAGVLFIRPVELARDVLARAGRVRYPGWEALRRLRILKLFEDREVAGLLAYFNADQLRSGQGYADAFAHTIEELEESGLDPQLCADVADRLREENRRNGDRLHDLAAVWSVADGERGAHVTTPQTLTEAARLLADQPGLCSGLGPSHALLVSSPSTALLRFLRALDDCQVVFQEARPLRTDTQRWRDALELPQPPPVAAADTELSLVHRYLFELPERLTDPQRPRSSGPDGSVDLEEHSTIEDEVEAAAIWVTEQIAAGTPLEQIALLAPEVQAYALPLFDRLKRTTAGDGQQPMSVHIASGMSLADTSAGRRFQILLEALLHALEAEATIRLIPALRRGPTDAEYVPRLSPSRAAEIVYGAGINGGSPGDTSGVREWVERLTRRRDALRQLVAETDEDDDSRDEPEKRKQIIDRQHANRWLRDVDPVLPGIESLQQVAELIVEEAPLTTVWAAVHEFAKNWLRLPPDPPNLLALLAQRLQPILAHPVASTITGRAAVRFLMEQLHSESMRLTRFGEPSVFIGSTAHAAGLSFAAVRLVGLAEGALPHTPHDDPIVPDVLRRRVEELAQPLCDDIIVPRLADIVLGEIHDAGRVINGARQRLALSAPRQWTDRSDREVSGVMLEVATALGREAAGAGGDVPTSGRLRSAYFGPGRRARSAAAVATPLSPRALLTSVTVAETGMAIHVPQGWMSGASTDIGRLHRLAEEMEAGDLGAMDGVIADTWKVLGTPPGLGERPLSASAINILLSCPHRFMLERLMHLTQPATRPSSDAIDPIAYGSLFHAAVERFMGEAGAALCAREGKLDDWVDRARAIAAEEFDELCHVYPLRGADATERERSRLLRQMERLVDYEWHKPRREFVATELGFGEPEPVRLAVGDGELFVRGAIDRVDRIAPGALAVRDIKTGRVRDLIDEPMNPARDLQIGLYTLALEASGGVERVTEAAYVHPSVAQEQERSFTGSELDRLRQHTDSWLRTAHAILVTGAFVRTPNPSDCFFCPFVPACGDAAQRRSTLKLDALPESHPLAPFVRLKNERGEEG